MSLSQFFEGLFSFFVPAKKKSTPVSSSGRQSERISPHRGPRRPYRGGRRNPEGNGGSRPSYDRSGSQSRGQSSSRSNGQPPRVSTRPGQPNRPVSSRRPQGDSRGPQQRIPTGNGRPTNTRPQQSQTQPSRGQQPRSANRGPQSATTIVSKQQGVLIGEVTHFFSRIDVVVLKMTDGTLQVGDRIRIQSKDGGFTQTVVSIQIESIDVKVAKKGQLVGLKVVKPVAVGAQVFKVT